MEVAMDELDASGLPTGSRRQAREDEILDWWRDYRTKPRRSLGGVQVRDKSDGSNRYGVIPWEVPLRDQGAPPVGQLEEPEAVHSGYTFVTRPTTRRQQRRAVRNRQRQGPVV